MTAAVDAARAITDKAERSLANLKEGDTKAAEKRRQAAAMLSVAAQLDPAHARRASELGDVVASDADRQLAANEVHALASRRESTATEKNLGAKAKKGWIRGGDDIGLLIQPQKLRVAIELYELALSLHYESYWAYLKGLLQERLGDFAGAVATFEQIRGHYTQSSAPHLERCRRKLAGSYDRDAALDATFGDFAEKLGKSGHKDAALVQSMLGGLRDFISQVNDADADPAQADDVDESALDRAAMAAQTFAELLASGDYDRAHAMLATNLNQLGAADLKREYTQMIGLEGEADELPEAEVSVILSETHMPDMLPQDIGWVYVAISGDSFNEAVTVTVTREQEALKIRTLEWGRP